MENRTLPELHCKNLEGATQLVRLAIDDALTVQHLLADLATRLARECTADARECAADALDSSGKAPADGEAAVSRARYLRRVTPLIVDTAHQLAEAGAATRTRFSRILTERLASGSHESLEAYQAFFKVLPSQATNAADLMRHALNCSDVALEHMAATAAASSGQNQAAALRATSCA
jgi:hypothetical protein